MPPATAIPRVRPIEGFAKAVGQCSAESTAYGKCIFMDYQNVTKDKCLDEFMRLKSCVQAKSKRK
ncbi:Similar to Uncharacterized protein C17orf89 homolog; acc. no. A2AMZ4 [Pyronema omphalodes CBS 100304]|uniref:Similar to Uncharacterized protein C17orf89 homolog acc. no. A2AMZ4 n=1 Tax=Pyronema omphalodes (strain CBS 100304) TaxID=1076935 RepID=U4L903_PYROM|nr:Similar to Uncharacterized protein C17orf89 homolog; acc. no. A2AMZ4 [Pyronema omphalodes CBS 100304]